MVAQRPKNNCSKLLTSHVAAPERSMSGSRSVSLAKRAILLRSASRDLSLLWLSHSAASWALLAWAKMREQRNFTMASVSRSLSRRVRSLYAFVTASLRKSFGMEPRDGDFASQRMCPFCGLITPRYETCCLECGKSLKPA